MQPVDFEQEYTFISPYLSLPISLSLSPSPYLSLPISPYLSLSLFLLPGHNTSLDHGSYKSFDRESG